MEGAPRIHAGEGALQRSGKASPRTMRFSAGPRRGRGSPPARFGIGFSFLAPAVVVAVVGEGRISPPAVGPRRRICRCRCAGSIALRLRSNRRARDARRRRPHARLLARPLRRRSCRRGKDRVSPPQRLFVGSQGHPQHRDLPGLLLREACHWPRTSWSRFEGTGGMRQRLPAATTCTCFAERMVVQKFRRVARCLRVA